MSFGKISLVACAALTAVAPAAAQEPTGDAPPAIPVPVNGAERYAPADFSRFAPRTALDMVDKIPGFLIVTGTNGGDRGLGAATENVLINGERIANKATDARTALARITAAEVAYIDIVDGAGLNVPGLTGRVANVVLVAGAGSGGFTTTIRWQPEWRPRLDKNWLNGEISTTGKIGGTNVTLSLKNEASRQGHWGPERVHDAAGVLLFTRDEFGAYDGDRPRLSAALARTTTNGNKWNFNLGGQLQLLGERVDSVSEQPANGIVREMFAFKEDEYNFDVGGDYELGLGKGRLKLIGLYRFEHSPFVDSFIVDRTIGGRTGERFKQTADESESILRGEYSWRTGGGTDWQVALEGAYNQLDVDSEFAVLQPDGSFLPVPFGGERTKVEEKRGEASLTWGRSLASNLTAQVNLGAEFSELTSSGPGGLTRRFVRPKGKVALAWKVGGQTTINWFLQRRVDQLDFFDFASSVDVANGQGNGGNGLLVPPILNRTELEVVQDMGGWGNASIAFAYAYAQDLVDQVPLSPTTEGRGNLPPAHLYRISSKATLLLDRLGWKGARINSDVTWRRNRVRDPLTNQWRDQSGGQDYVVDLSLRHDVPGTNLAWGAGYFDEQYSPNLRLGAIEREYTEGPFVTAFVEHKNVAGFTVKLSYRNLANMKDGFDRTVFVDRRDGPVAFSEQRLRRFGRFFQLTVTGTL
ncbi:Plug domain-containing protein [Sphingopyxis sp. RIFCSPHIGHO2_12_FULL_65_19]|uniref:Plug domain-containing protein n=1 Tax=Sphingopyxis sp. RIFCSPHIGHO2_12_FULL_65_19 TaxID=1802172 RepID=UPI000A7C3C3F|nr:Plug domain-containing protein [Sphingopyxis sp. RIFCSPHIGHO2_12_FULL_65_19]